MFLFYSHVDKSFGQKQIIKRSESSHGLLNKVVNSPILPVIKLRFRSSNQDTHRRSEMWSNPQKETRPHPRARAEDDGGCNFSLWTREKLIRAENRLSIKQHDVYKHLNTSRLTHCFNYARNKQLHAYHSGIDDIKLTQTSLHDLKEKLFVWRCTEKPTHT